MVLSVWLAAVLGVLLIGGVGYLLWLGGSWYYLLMGLGLGLVAILMLRRQRAVLWLYAGLLLASLAWAVYEVHFYWWQLAPRIDLWCVFGFWLLLPFVNRYIDRSGQWRDGASGSLALGLVLGAAMAAYSLTQDYHRLPGSFDAERMAASEPQPADEWPALSVAGLLL